MTSNIGKNIERFYEIIKGRIRKDLKEFIKSDQIIGKKGKKTVTIPLPYIDIPRFKYGRKEDEGGIGQGPGPIGTPIAPGDVEGEGEGDGPKAGQGSAEHPLEIEVTIEEIAKILEEELKLPRIEPKGKKRIYTEFDKYAGLRRVGPDALLRYDRSYFEALLRELASGEYDFEDPIVVLTKDDMRYRSWKTKRKPESDAVCIYLMDVSGSMSERHKSIARKISYWTDVWLKSQYKGLESAYVIHDYEAQEVDEHTFYHTTTSGGTRIWSGYDLVNRIIDKRYNPAEWNIYVFQYSDGENWGDNSDEINILEKEIMRKVNLLCYGQLDLAWWENTMWASHFKDYVVEGPYKRSLEEYKKNSKYGDKIMISQIRNEDDILPTIKIFLGTGK